VSDGLINVETKLIFSSGLLPDPIQGASQHHLFMSGE